MKKRIIKKAMRKNMVWCTHEVYAPNILPCSDLNCPFKEDKARLAKPKELKQCRSFQITKPTDEFENSVSVLIAKRKAVPEIIPDKTIRRKIAVA
jgi:hypothetical protein